MNTDHNPKHQAALIRSLCDPWRRKNIKPSK